MFFSSTPYLSFAGPGGKIRRYSLRRTPFVIGSGEASDLVINHEEVSTRHIVIQQSGDRWWLEASGHTPSYLNDQAVSEQNLQSGDLLALAEGSLLFKFINPAQEKARAAKPKTQAKTVAERRAAAEGVWRKRKIPILLFGGMILFWGIVGWLVYNPEKDLAQLAANTPETVRAVLDGGEFAGGIRPVPLAECIVSAGERGRLDGWIRATQTPYWQLAQKYSDGALPSAITSDEDYRALRERLDRDFGQARNLENLQRKAQAAKIYGQIIKLVPDAQCAVYTLASSRILSAGEAGD